MKFFCLTGIEQLIRRVHHSQANGLVESENATIKNCHIKVFLKNAAQWSYIIDGALFPNSVKKCNSAKISLLNSPKTEIPFCTSTSNTIYYILKLVNPIILSV